MCVFYYRYLVQNDTIGPNKSGLVVCVWTLYKYRKDNYIFSERSKYILTCDDHNNIFTGCVAYILPLGI